MKIDKLKKEFVKSVNTAQNFMEYDEILQNWVSEPSINLSYVECAKKFIDEIFDDLTYNIDNIEDLKTYIKDEEFEGVYLSDWINEKSDGLVDIYYNDIYKSTHLFSEWVDEARNEFGVGENLEKDIQQGQYLCYKEIIYKIIDELREYLDNN